MMKTALWKALLPLAMLLFKAGFSLRHFLVLRIVGPSFKPRPDDIFIATYPKSGTTLVQMILYQLKTDGNMDFSHINAVCPFLDQELVRHRHKYLDELKSPRCLKTHLLAHQLPMKTGKYIYVIRDVRDVVVSAYYHDLLLGGVDQGLERFTQRFLSSAWPGFPNWFEHLQSWWPHRKDPNVLFLCYEDMVADLEETVRKIARFCEIDVREEDMPRILERCSFAFMKQHDEKFDPRFQSQGEFIRKGKIGSGSEMPPGSLEIFNKKLTAAARKLGCERGEPYRELVAPLG